MQSGKYEYQTEFARRYVAEGEARGEALGEARGRAHALLSFLAAQGFSSSAMPSACAFWPARTRRSSTADRAHNNGDLHGGRARGLRVRKLVTARVGLAVFSEASHQGLGSMGSPPRRGS
jgi:hypothetical protein